MKKKRDSVEAQLTILQGQLFDGFLLLGDMPNYRDVARNLKNMNKPYVSVAAGIDIEVPMVHTDEVLGIGLILDYLTGLGHTNIAFMGSLAWPLVRRRLQIFREQMAARGLNLPPEHVTDLDNFPYQPGNIVATGTFASNSGRSRHSLASRTGAANRHPLWHGRLWSGSA